MSRIHVVVNGCVLTEAQTACVRVAIESMLKALDGGPFADDRHGREMSELYYQRLREVRDLWAESSWAGRHFIPLWAVKWAIVTRPPNDMESILGSIQMCALSSCDPLAGRADGQSMDAFNAHCSVHVHTPSRRPRGH